MSIYLLESPPWRPLVDATNPAFVVYCNHPLVGSVLQPYPRWQYIASIPRWQHIATTPSSVVYCNHPSLVVLLRPGTGSKLPLEQTNIVLTQHTNNKIMCKPARIHNKTKIKLSTESICILCKRMNCGGGEGGYVTIEEKMRAGNNIVEKRPQMQTNRQTKSSPHGPGSLANALVSSKFGRLPGKIYSMQCSSLLIKGSLFLCSNSTTQFLLSKP